MPFRSAYKICGQIVSYCIKENKVLESMTLGEYKKFDMLFEQDLFEEINLSNCVNKRISEGGTSPQSVEKQIEVIKGKLKNA